MKTMKMMTWIVVAGLVLALAPGAMAQTILYTENFVDAANVGKALSASSVGWTQNAAWGDPYVGPHIDDTVGGIYAANTPDGDGYYAQDGGGQSSSQYAASKPGEYTILAADRGAIVFTTDWAKSNTSQMKFLAVVGGIWYGSEDFGTDGSTNGDMDSTGVKEWVVDTSVSADTGTWYASLAGAPDGYEWRDGNQWDTANPLNGLPAGDITQFGLGWRVQGGALDNFRVTGGPTATPGTLIYGK